MPSSFSKLGYELPATGELTGAWGPVINENFEMIEESTDGQVSITLGSAGTTGSPNTLNITDGATANARHKFVRYADGGDLGGPAYVRFGPNDVERILYVQNALSGNRTIFFFQGTYNAANDVGIAAGTTVLIRCNGGGSGAVVSVIDVTSSIGPANNVAITGGTLSGLTNLSSAAATLTTATLPNVTITGGTITGITDLAIADGGTGSSTAAGARTNLGLGTAAVENTMPVAKGGTGATTESSARSNLGLAIGTNVQAQNAALQTIATAGGVAFGSLTSSAVATTITASTNTVPRTDAIKAYTDTARAPDAHFAGNYTSGTGTLPLTTTLRNEVSSSASLASDTVTLQAGTYYVECSASLRLSTNLGSVNGASVALRNETLSTFIGVLNSVRTENRSSCGQGSMPFYLTLGLANSFTLNFQRENSGFEASTPGGQGSHSGAPKYDHEFKVWKLA